MQTNRGIAPLIILAIIALLAVGTGGAVYVSKSKQQQATSTPAVSVATGANVGTGADSKTQVTTTPVTGATTPSASKASSETKTETKTQPATVTTSATKSVTKSAFVIPATPSMQASEVKTYKQGLTYGRDLVCTSSKDNVEHYYSPSYPGIYATVYHYRPDNRTIIESKLNLQIFDWNKEYSYDFTVYGDANPTWDTIRSTPGRVFNESELSSKEIFTPSWLNESMMGRLFTCSEQTFDHAILDTSKYTYGKSYDYYLKSGKDWECTFKDEKGEGATHFSHLYPEKWYWYARTYATPGYPARESYSITDLNVDREYEWDGTPSVTYSDRYTQFGYCTDNAYSLPDIRLNNCVEKPQDPSLFELPKDRKFTVIADYSRFCK